MFQSLLSVLTSLAARFSVTFHAECAVPLSFCEGRDCAARFHLLCSHVRKLEPAYVCGPAAFQKQLCLDVSQTGLVGNGFGSSVESVIQKLSLLLLLLIPSFNVQNSF